MDVPSSPEPKSRARSSVSPLLGIGLVLVGGVALAWPAFDNGFPLVFQDTSWYLAPLFNVGEHPLRTIGYSIFALIALTVPSFWSIVLVQSLTTSAVLTRVAWIAADRPEDRTRLAVLGLLSVLVFSVAAKYSSWLMADITTSWHFLAGALWLIAPGMWDRAVAFGVGVVAVLAHNSHLPLALATSGAIVSVSLFRRSGVDRRAALGLLAAPSMSVPCVWLANAITTARAEVLRGTEAFLLYNLSDSGVLLDTLDAWCGEREWQMCSFRAEIADHVAENNGWLLFDPSSPFYRLGGHGSSEPRDVVLHAFRCCAWRIVWTTVVEAWTQFWEVDSRDGLLAQDTEPALALLQSMARPSASRLLERMNAGWGRFETATARRELAQLRRSRQRTSGDARVLSTPFPSLVFRPYCCCRVRS